MFGHCTQQLLSSTLWSDSHSHGSAPKSASTPLPDLPRSSTPPLHTARTDAPQYHSTLSPIREAPEDGENGSGAKTRNVEAGRCSSDMIDFLDHLPCQVPQQLTTITQARELCRVNPQETRTHSLAPDAPQKHRTSLARVPLGASPPVDMAAGFELLTSCTAARV